MAYASFRGHAGVPQKCLGYHTFENKSCLAQAIEGVTDYSGSIDVEVITKKFSYQDGNFGQLIRFIEFECYITGSATVYYQTDTVKVWTSLGTVSDSVSSNARIPFDACGRWIQFKITTTEAFTMDWYRVWCKPNGER
jgi:hypothetical protein